MITPRLSHAKVITENLEDENSALYLEYSCIYNAHHQI